MTDPDPTRYADGRLDRATRRALAPPAPSAADWKRVSDGIALRVLPARRRLAGQRLACAAAVLVCAAGSISLFGRVSPPPPRLTPDVAQARPALDDPLAEFAVLPVATDDEVRIAVLRGDWDGGLVAGAHPLDGELRLATADEVLVERVPDVMDAVPDFGDAAMVFGLRGKRSEE